VPKELAIANRSSGRSEEKQSGPHAPRNGAARIWVTDGMGDQLIRNQRNG